MRQRHGAVMRRDRIEVAVDDSDQRVTVGPLIARHDTIGRWIRRGTQIGAGWPEDRPAGEDRPVPDRWRVRAPLRFGQLAILDLHAVTIAVSLPSSTVP